MRSRCPSFTPTGLADGRGSKKVDPSHRQLRCLAICPNVWVPRCFRIRRYTYEPVQVPHSLSAQILYHGLYSLGVRIPLADPVCWLVFWDRVTLDRGCSRALKPLYDSGAAEARMVALRLVTWNVEWMNDLFGPNDRPPAFRPDDEEPYHTPGSTVRQRRDDLAGVLNELAPDIVVVVEGPNRTEELRLFFDEDVDGEWQVVVQHSRAQSQNLGLAVRIDEGKFRDPPFFYYDTSNIPAFDPFQVDTDNDEILEQYHFERRPLYAEIRPLGARNFRVLGLHLKSKGLFGAYEWSQWWQRADANRRKILAQATHLRLSFLDPYLTEEPTANIPLVVCGDINDGPGLDASEKRLFGSAVERLMGAVWHPERCLGNALFDALPADDRESLNFSPITTTSYKDPIFNKMWHRVWIDHILYTRNAPEPWVRDAFVYRVTPDGVPLWRAHPHASDHFPVVATVVPPST